MDAYDFHVKFEEEIKQDVDQTHYVIAFSDERKAELKRLKYNGQVKRVTSTVISEVHETVYNRMLDWYKTEYNPLLLKSEKSFKNKFYDTVSYVRYATLWCYALAFLHSVKE